MGVGSSAIYTRERDRCARGYYYYISPCACACVIPPRLSCRVAVFMKVVKSRDRERAATLMSKPKEEKALFAYYNADSADRARAVPRLLNSGYFNYL